MKYYIIAGEASGDLHGAGLIKGLKNADPQAELRCWGGEKMEAAGGTIVRHYREMAFMGFLEVVKNLRKIRRNFKDAKKDILQFQPTVLILIDYPGFNLRMAKWAKRQGLSVFYYISPQIWAWNTGRVKIIKQTVDRMFVILPFEKAFYAQYGLEVDFVGHPLMDIIPPPSPKVTQSPIVALLPGSRKQEIRLMLPLMLSICDQYPNYQFIIAAAPSIPPAFYKDLCQDHPITIQQGQTYELLQQAHIALVTSGTATLETALFNVPQIVCYKGSQVSYLIARQLIKVNYISLVNLILDQALVKELIQEECTIENLKREFEQLELPERRQEQLAGYQVLRAKLGQAGAGDRAGQRMVDLLKNEPKFSRRV